MAALSPKVFASSLLLRVPRAMASLNLAGRVSGIEPTRAVSLESQNASTLLSARHFHVDAGVPASWRSCHATSFSSTSTSTLPTGRWSDRRRYPFGVRASSQSATLTEYETKGEGEPGTLEFRLFFKNKAGDQVSPWHDIPLSAGDGLYHMVCEIPRETKAKMEVATEEAATPIKQDIKKGKLRFYPYNINWNYGLLPQTWEDPGHANQEVEGCFGDNDPVDCVDISGRTAEMGEVYAVKPLAVLAMIDEGELDWKVVTIRADDPKAAAVDDVESVEKEFPGTLTAIRDWFRDYKIPDGKPANRFGLDDKPANKAYTIKVIEETHEAWQKLVKRSVSAEGLFIPS